MVRKAILISIHPAYVQKIIAGEKKVEFRRSWAAKRADLLVIYATFPIQRIVAIANVEQVVIGSRSKLWGVAKAFGGGISRSKLFDYLSGKTSAVAIEIKHVTPIAGGIDPKRLFGRRFKPPQSYRYLSEDEYSKVDAMIGD